jgi:hypothetical protein
MASRQMLIDSSFLYSLYDPNDRYHQQTLMTAATSASFGRATAHTCNFCPKNSAHKRAEKGPLPLFTYHFLIFWA